MFELKRRKNGNRYVNPVLSVVLIVIMLSPSVTFGESSTRGILQVDALNSERILARAERLGWRPWLHLSPKVSESLVRVWALTKGPEGVALLWLVCQDENEAKHRFGVLHRDNEIAVTRSREVILAIVTAGRPGAGEPILERLLGTRKDPEPVQIAAPGPPFNVVETVQLPDLSFGHLNRSELLIFFVQRGWRVADATAVTEGEGYVAVNYPLTKDDVHDIDLTVYRCRTGQIANGLLKLTRRDRTLFGSKRGDVVVVVKTNNSKSGRTLQRALTRESRRARW